jgi:hypothetical protein
VRWPVGRTGSGTTGPRAHAHHSPTLRTCAPEGICANCTCSATSTDAALPPFACLPCHASHNCPPLACALPCHVPYFIECPSRSVHVAPHLRCSPARHVAVCSRSCHVLYWSMRVHQYNNHECRKSMTDICDDSDIASSHAMPNPLRRILQSATKFENAMPTLLLHGSPCRRMVTIHSGGGAVAACAEAAAAAAACAAAAAAICPRGS